MPMLTYRFPTWLVPVCGLIALGAALGSMAAAETRGPQQEHALALSTEGGVWKFKSQPVFDTEAKVLSRKKYLVWDGMPSRDLSFSWLPDKEQADKEGRIDGNGRLIWRTRDKPVYDATSIFAEYTGTMRNGKQQGRGTYIEQSGLAYDGMWTESRPDGHGRLSLPDGSEYVGLFRNGVANGRGRYTDATGEVFDGNFLRGLRDGLGKTTLPNGRSYTSRWREGGEDTESRKLRFAQIGQLQTAGDDIRIGVVVQRSPETSDVLRYTSVVSDAGLLIQPDDKRLMGLWKGSDEIQLKPDEEAGDDSGSFGVFGLTEERLAPVAITLEIQNRSGSTINAVEAYLDVESSLVDLQPAIQLSVGTQSVKNGCGVDNSYQPHFYLENYGWGPADSAKVRYAFVNPALPAKPSNLDRQVEIKPLADRAEFDVETELRARGVNVALLKQRGADGLKCRSQSSAGCLSEIKASGVFGTLASSIAIVDDVEFRLGVSGTLEYQWQDSSGAQRQRISPFNAKLLLAKRPYSNECGEGALREPLRSKLVELSVDKKAYRVPLGLQRPIASNQTIRYAFAIKAPKSSQHKFKIAVKLSDDRQIASRPIELIYFKPKNIDLPNR
jgi:hypothetical protein